MGMIKHLAVPLLIAPLLMGCELFGGVRVDEIATTTAQPSNVGVFLTVADGDEAPPQLDKSAFRIFEEGVDVTDASQLQLLDPAEVATHHSLLLVDLSGPELERKELAEAVSAAVGQLRKQHPVTVYGFDGEPTPRLIGDFGRSSSGEAPKLDESRFKQRDPSRDLNGAVVKAVAQLDARLMRQKRPIRRGSLILFLRGPDLAGRTTREAALDVLKKSEHRSYSVVLGEAAGARFGLHGEVQSALGPSDGMSQVASLVEAGWAQEYLLSYCSPGRSGKRRLRIEVRFTVGESEKSGSLNSEIDATGFKSGCDSKKLPRFVIQASKAPAKDDSPPDSSDTKAQPAPEPESEPVISPADGVVPPPDKPGYAPR